MEARAVALRILHEIERGAYANLVLDQTLAGIKNITAPDRGLITEIVYGTVKYRTRLDWIIEKMVKKADRLETGPRILLRLSFYQLLFMDRIPPFAVTNEAARLAKKFFHAGVASLVNGVLRSYLRAPEQVVWPDEEDDPLQYLEVVYSHPRWMLERWLERYGFPNTVKLCEFNNTPADLWVRTNTLKCSPRELEEKLILEGCTVEKSSRVPEGLLLKFSPPLSSLHSFQEGLFTVQDESSMLAAYALNPQPLAEVVDICAGPGGKTTHLAQLMENSGKIIACDIHRHRIRLIEENAGRLGINIIETRLQDATRINKDMKQHYGLVLVDAPCSGLGVLRRRPDSRWRKSLKDVAELAKLQYGILESVYDVLSPGGRLVYSTCTLEPEENCRVINNFLAAYPDMSGYDLTPYFPYLPKNQSEKEQLKKGMRQFLPFEDGIEGFFISGLQKDGDVYGK